MVDDFEVRSSELWDEVRFTISDEGHGFTMEGPLALYGQPSRLLSDSDLAGNVRERGLLGQFGKRTFREIVEPGAFKRSLNAAPDIVLHYQHDERSLPLGRTKAGTLQLIDEETQVRSKADLPDNEWGRPVRDAVKRGDIGGISFRMGKVLSEWQRDKLPDGYDGPVRHLREIQLRREISLVTFPGYDTFAQVRALAEEADLEPDELAAAFTVLRTPETKLTTEQRDLLMAAINARVDEPYLNPKLVQMQEKLASLAG